MKPILIEKTPKNITVTLDSNPFTPSEDIREKHDLFWEEQKL
ncbi:hypothetical protein [Peribacillus simplex]|nr:hypothetical protein [Peribacillus simplex]WHY58586.1 hypothetical protein QNH43_10155 [Peribacillus simplex]